jgi:hypothetical protein
MRPFGAMRDAAGLNDVPEKVEVSEIEPHGAGFVTGEGKLRGTHIAAHLFGPHVSPIMKALRA